MPFYLASTLDADVAPPPPGRNLESGHNYVVEGHDDEAADRMHDKLEHAAAAGTSA